MQQPLYMLSHLSSPCVAVCFHVICGGVLQYSHMGNALASGSYLAIQEASKGAFLSRIKLGKFTPHTASYTEHERSDRGVCL